MSLFRRNPHSRFFLDGFNGSRSGSPGAASSIRTRDHDTELEHDDDERNPLLSNRARQARRLGLTFDADQDTEPHDHDRMRDSIYSHHGHMNNRRSTSGLFGDYTDHHDIIDVPEDTPLVGEDDNGVVDVENATDRAPLLPIFSAQQLGRK